MTDLAGLYSCLQPGCCCRVSEPEYKPLKCSLFSGNIFQPILERLYSPLYAACIFLDPSDLLVLVPWAVVVSLPDEERAY